RIGAAAAAMNQPREWAHALTHIARVSKERGTEAPAETLPKLDVDRGQRGTAYGIAVGKLWPDGLIAIATHRAAAAGIEALIGRHVGDTHLDALDRFNGFGDTGRAGEEGSHREHTASSFGVEQPVQIEIVSNAELRDDVVRAARTVRTGRSESERGPQTMRRIFQGRRKIR